MSVEHGGGYADDQRADDVQRDAGRHVRDTELHVFAHLYESYAASLFDYCDVLLQDTIAAADAVQDSLVDVDTHIGSVPDPDRLRLALYEAARWQCLTKLTGGRGDKLSSRPKTTTLDELGLAVPEFEAAGTGGETVLVLTAALEWLAERDREVLSLAFRHRFNDADLAALLGSSPRRAHALLSGARTRFEELAPVVGALRAAFREGRPSCRLLARMIASPDLASLPLTPQRGSQLARHLRTCPDCALTRRDRAFTADQIPEIPLAIPPGRLRLRITRTALALGSYRRRVAGRPGKPGRGSTQSGPPPSSGRGSAQSGPPPSSGRGSTQSAPPPPSPNQGRHTREKTAF
jgi:DNA-directed RNA polymerase specialized sigma24 family protein